MHIVILHGYILQGTGSNIYVANIAKTWKAQGHRVTVLCQDRNAESLPFVDEFFTDTGQSTMPPPEPGTLRVIVPDINNILPAFIIDKYEGYEVKTIQEMDDKEIETHISMVAGVLRNICVHQKVDRVFANHALLNPAIADEALKELNIPFDIKIHGSAIEFCVVPEPRLKKYIYKSFEHTNKIIAGTIHIKNRIIEVFGKEIDTEKIKIIPPGIDPDLFVIADNFDKTNVSFLKEVKKIISEQPNGRNSRKIKPLVFPEKIPPNKLHAELVEKTFEYNQRVVDFDLPDKWDINKNTPVIFFFGKFLQTKGIGELLSIAPSIIRNNPDLRFVFSGFGSYREHMEELLNAFQEGNLIKARTIGKAGSFISEINIEDYFFKISEGIRNKIIITGFLPHQALSKLLPLASVCIVPSRLSEAFGMVGVEAMACGVIPICNNHSGLKDILKVLSKDLPKLGNITIKERQSFFNSLSDTILDTLKFIYPEGFDNKTKLNFTRKKLREIAIDNFSWDKIAKQLIS
ncbi:MAG: glycosyltransferase family 4 protein [Victivallales bacterium]|nr:glycosyltransferase family 4 protein [Victivallales bacterium]